MREIYKRTYPDSMDSAGDRSDASFLRGYMRGTSENSEKGNYEIYPTSDGAMVMQILGYQPDGNDQFAGYTYQMEADLEAQVSYATPLPYAVRYVDVKYMTTIVKGSGSVFLKPYITDENGVEVATGEVLKGETYRIDMSSLADAPDAYKHTYYLNCYASSQLSMEIKNQMPHCNVGVWSITFKYF